MSSPTKPSIYTWRAGSCGSCINNRALQNSATTLLQRDLPPSPSLPPSLLDLRLISAHTHPSPQVVARCVAMTAAARVLLLLPRQLITPLRLAHALAPQSRAAVRGYFWPVLQQATHRCWSTSSSSCEQYPQAPITNAAPGAPCPRDGKGEGYGEAATATACGGEKAVSGAHQDGSDGAGAPAPPAHPQDKEAAVPLRAAPAGRKGRSGVQTPRQRGRPAKPQGNKNKKPARPGAPKQGRGGGGGIIHVVAPRRSSSSSPAASSTPPSTTRLRAATKKRESED